MKKKMFVLLIIGSIILIILYSSSNILFRIFLFVILFFYIISIFLLVLNFLLKKTNWYKNIFSNTEKFVSNSGYRTNLIRNIDIVNVGSNPALYAFFYENINGENWSTGTQGLEMDFEILKYRFSLLKKNGIVVLPIVIFSSISEYLNSKPEYRSLKYYAKYTKVLDYHQILSLPKGRAVLRFLQYPLFYNWKNIKYLFEDERLRTNIDLCIAERVLQNNEMELDADQFIKGWKDEFDIKDFDSDLSKKYKESMNSSANIMRNMIDFLLERELVPVIVFPPMSSVLSSRFSERAKKNYLYDFVTLIGRQNVPFLDYSSDSSLADLNLYYNSLFMNLNGRKHFTKRLLEDLTDVIHGKQNQSKIVK